MGRSKPPTTKPPTGAFSLSTVHLPEKWGAFSLSTVHLPEQWGAFSLSVILRAGLEAAKNRLFTRLVQRLAPVADGSGSPDTSCSGTQRQTGKPGRYRGSDRTDTVVPTGQKGGTDCQKGGTEGQT